MEKGIFLYPSIIETIMDLGGGDRIITADAVLAVVEYAYYGREYTGDNQVARVALYNFKPLIDKHEARINAGRKGGLAGGGGAPKGNQNARKHWNTEGETIANKSKTIAKKEALFQNNSKQLNNSKQKQNNSNNSLNTNELQGGETIANNSDISMIKTGSLDNTSLLTELVLSNNPDNNPECKMDETPAPAPCNGRAGVSPLTSENRNGGESTPIPSSANSQSLQSTPPPTPAPQRISPRAEGSKLSDTEWEQLTANVRADYERGKAMADAERDAAAKGEPLPPAAKGIKPVIDDSDSAQQERESKRVHDLKHLIEMAQTEEEREELRAYL